MAKSAGARRQCLEEELAAARAALAGAAEADERARLAAVARELEEKLERLILALEIERQSDA